MSFRILMGQTIVNIEKMQNICTFDIVFISRQAHTLNSHFCCLYQNQISFLTYTFTEFRI